MRLLWIGTGWKMNKTAAEARQYVATLKALVQMATAGSANLFIVPPFTALATAREAIGDWPLLLGAQNMHWAPSGAYTGEISAAMLTDAGVDLVELGHSERRIGFGETDADLNRKIRAALRHGLRPLLCVGDNADERDAGASAETTVRQLKLAFAGLAGEDIGRCLVAYEPVWAIGEQGVAATPEHIANVHSQIHKALRELTPHPVPVLYGGSVNHDNAFSLASEPTVDGLFIGRAAWQPENFAAIIETVMSARAAMEAPDVVPVASAGVPHATDSLA